MLFRDRLLVATAVFLSMCVGASAGAQDAAQTVQPVGEVPSASSAFPVDALPSRGVLPANTAEIENRKYILSRMKALAAEQDAYCKLPYADPDTCRRPISKNEVDAPAKDAPPPAPPPAIDVRGIRGVSPNLEADILGSNGKRISVRARDTVPDGRVVKWVSSAGIKMETGEFYPYRAGAR